MKPNADEDPSAAINEGPPSSQSGAPPPFEAVLGDAALQTSHSGADKLELRWIKDLAASSHAQNLRGAAAAAAASTRVCGSAADSGRCHREAAEHAGKAEGFTPSVFFFPIICFLVPKHRQEFFLGSDRHRLYRLSLICFNDSHSENTIFFKWEGRWNPGRHENTVSTRRRKHALIHFFESQRHQKQLSGPSMTKTERLKRETCCFQGVDGSVFTLIVGQTQLRRNWDDKDAEKCLLSTA